MDLAFAESHDDIAPLRHERSEVVGSGGRAADDRALRRRGSAVAPRPPRAPTAEYRFPSDARTAERPAPRMDSAPPFAIGARSDPSGTPVVHIAGEIDIATAERVRAAIAGAVSTDGSGLLIDLREVTFLDSTGLSTLLAADEDAGRRGGGMTLLVARGPCRGCSSSRAPAPTSTCAGPTRPPEAPAVACGGELQVFVGLAHIVRNARRPLGVRRRFAAYRSSRRIRARWARPRDGPWT